ncbi:hypothetical protein ACO0K3_05950 [Undibacterium sp. Rencai35W]|uniref:hypothetical protein n=1 Tax=Undibacterium sp. Rencai35W TaxID=3413046 RepID=UPI003BF18126
MKNLTLNLDKFTEKVAAKENEKELYWALQSFAKRNVYASHYYEDFLLHSEEGKLSLAKFDCSGNLRNNFEALIVAFIANAHAMIDSFPFVLYLALKPLSYLDSKGKENNISEIDCGWTHNFLKSICNTYPCNTSLANLFQELIDDEDFKLLKKISNNNKHKFLARIKNDGKSLEFEMIDFKKNKITYVGVQEFLVRSHDHLIPKVINLYEEVAKTALGKS